MDRELTGEEKFATWATLIGGAGCLVWILAFIAFWIFLVAMFAIS